MRKLVSSNKNKRNFLDYFSFVFVYFDIDIEIEILQTFTLWSRFHFFIWHVCSGFTIWIQKGCYYFLFGILSYQIFNGWWLNWGGWCCWAASSSMYLFLELFVDIARVSQVNATTLNNDFEWILITSNPLYLPNIYWILMLWNEFCLVTLLFWSFLLSTFILKIFLWVL